MLKIRAPSSQRGEAKGEKEVVENRHLKGFDCILESLWLESEMELVWQFRVVFCCEN